MPTRTIKSAKVSAPTTIQQLVIPSLLYQHVPFKAFERIEGENGGKPKSDWRRRFRITVNEVAARGDFDRLRCVPHRSFLKGCNVPIQVEG